jgi:hypothetical protein
MVANVFPLRTEPKWPEASRQEFKSERGTGATVSERQRGDAARSGSSTCSSGLVRETLGKILRSATFVRFGLIPARVNSFEISLQSS